MMPAAWRMTGDLLVSCNCEVFCACVLSLGKARPSEGRCYSWFGFRIAEGHAGPVDLAGLKVGLLLQVPGPMEQGDWTLGVYVDDGASETAAAALVEIFTGRAGGPLGWWSIMIATFLGTRRVPISFEQQGRGWRFAIPKIVDAEIEPVPGAAGDGLVRITNSRYWMSPEIVVCASKRSRVRDWGRNWDLGGKSAEHATFDWAGP